MATYSNSLPSHQIDNLASLAYVGNTIVVTITVSDLSGQDMADLMRQCFTITNNQKMRNLILDMQNVTMMDSPCLAVLIEIFRHMKQTLEYSRIALVNARRNVEYLFRVTQLDRVFPVYRDVITALSAVEKV